MKPFLKWAGGKYKIVDKILLALPKADKLAEPFVGSGAVFLNADYASFLLADTNPDLIHLYREVQKSGGNFIDMPPACLCQKTILKKFFISYAMNSTNAPTSAAVPHCLFI